MKLRCTQYQIDLVSADINEGFPTCITGVSLEATEIILKYVFYDERCLAIEKQFIFAALLYYKAVLI